MRRSRRARLGAAAAAILAAAFAVGVWIVVPLAASHALDLWAAAEPGRSAAARRVTVNPFTLTVTLHDVAVEAPAVSVAADRVAADFDAASLLGSVAALDALTIDGPQLRLGSPDTAAGAPPALADLVPRGRFAIARAAISGGRIEWLDDAEMPLVFAGLTARAFDLDNYTEAPAPFEIDVRGAAGGGVVRLEGEVVLRARTAFGRIDFENLDATQIATRFLASPSIAGAASGTADFEWLGAERALRLGNAAVRVSGTEIEWPSGVTLSAASLEAAADAELAAGERSRIAGTFALLRVALRDTGGDVWLEAERLSAAALDYRIDAGAANGTARIAARGVEIEPTAEAPGDVDVRLALALLEDPHGVAETTVDFRAGGGSAGFFRLLASAVLARLDAVAAAPFDALGAAVGVDGGMLAAVSFPAGEAAPSEPATIDALAEAMRARPRIGLRVHGLASRALDRDALAAQQIELHVTLATAGPTLIARPQPVDFDSPRHRDVLDEFAGERLRDEQRETIASYFDRTPDGQIVENERSAYYRALFDALVENEQIPDSGIERLGRYRARAISDGLAARGIAESRIEIAPILVRPPPDAGTEAGDAIEVPLEIVIAPSGAGDSQAATATGGRDALAPAAPGRASN